MTKYEQLKKRICEALPRLMELKEGQSFNYIPNKETKLKWEAKIIIESGGGQIADTGDYDDVYFDFFSHYNGFERLPIDKIEHFEILGIEPNLSDVLEYIGVDDEELPYYINVYGELMTSKSVFKAKWDLSKPLLKDQNEELIDYLLSL